MSQYVAFLRGINVGGHRPLKMEDLREMITGLGFKNVATYIQSGNIIFNADEEADRDFLATKIKLQIEKTFGYDVPVIITVPADLNDALAAFPFDKREGWKGYISLLANKPINEQVRELEAFSSKIEKFEIQDTILFSIVDKQADEKPKFSNSFVEKKLGVPATTRNLRTIHKIIALADSS